MNNAFVETNELKNRRGSRAGAELKIAGDTPATTEEAMLYNGH
jgi:hypothetical protein